jgi:hypothetical protein
MRNDIKNPEHWRDRAEDARAVARTLIDADFVRELLAIAVAYDRLAERAEVNRLRVSRARRAGGTLG